MPGGDALGEVMTENLKKAFAIAAHPDDIEFMMSGTLMRLKEAGYEIHYMNVANGCMGTDTLDHDEIVAVREAEAKAAADLIGAVYHPHLGLDDVGIFYNADLVSQLSSLIREVQPDIVLTHYPDEYMEDHANVCRGVVSAVFARGMRNFTTQPPVSPISKPVALYHAMPYGLHDQLRRLIQPECFVNVSEEMQTKREMLALHASQKEWLDVSQGVDAYLDTMTEMCREMGRMSEKFDFAEGWTRHLHLGLCAEDSDPLNDVLKTA